MSFGFFLQVVPGRVPTIAGQPLTIYMGFLVLGLAIATAVIGYLYHKRIVKIPIKRHRNIAIVTLGVTFLHGVLAAIDRFFPP